MTLPVPSAGNFLAFAALAAVIVAIPGPSVLFTISRALTVGRRVALWTVVGNAAGVYLQVVAVAFGMAVVVQRSAVAYELIKYVGAGYLVWLGVQAIRHRRSLIHAIPRRAAPPTRWPALRKGVLVGATNPKTIAVFATVLPGLADRSAGHPGIQMLALGAVCPVIALALDSIWAVLAGTAHGWLARSPGRLAAIGGTGGLVMIGVGAGLAASGNRD